MPSCSQVNAIEHIWWQVNIGSGNADGLDAIRQQAISCANIDPDMYCHMASLGHTELSHQPE